MSTSQTADSHDWESILYEAGGSSDVPALIPAPKADPGLSGIAAALQSERTMVRHDTREDLFTVTPAEGFPVVERFSPGWGFDNMTPAQIHEWENLPGAKLLLSPHGSGFVSDHVIPGRPALAAEPLAKVSSTKPPVRLQRLMHETPGKIYRAVCYFALLPAVINIRIDVG